MLKERATQDNSDRWSFGDCEECQSPCNSDEEHCSNRGDTRGATGISKQHWSPDKLEDCTNREGLLEMTSI